MSESSSTGDGEESWIQWFCGLPGHEMFCEVDRTYVEDGFNLYGLRQHIPNITECLDVILDRVGPDESDDEVLQSSYALYGLIHARYIVTTNGLEAMRKKHAQMDFGTCPRMLCRATAVIPLGIRDEPKVEGVKVFCPSCQDVYTPWHPQTAQTQLDGAYFGTTFAHLFCMTYEVSQSIAKEVYVPRIFGFRIHSARGGSAGRRRGNSAEIEQNNSANSSSRQQQADGTHDVAAAAAAAPAVADAAAANHSSTANKASAAVAASNSAAATPTASNGTRRQAAAGSSNAATGAASSSATSGNKRTAPDDAVSDGAVPAGGVVKAKRTGSGGPSTR